MIIELHITSKMVRISLTYQETMLWYFIQKPNMINLFLEYENFTNGVIDPGEQWDDGNLDK